MVDSITGNKFLLILKRKAIAKYFNELNLKNDSEDVIVLK